MLVVLVFILLRWSTKEASAADLLLVMLVVLVFILLRWSTKEASAADLLLVMLVVFVETSLLRFNLLPFQYTSLLPERYNLLDIFAGVLVFVKANPFVTFKLPSISVLLSNLCCPPFVLYKIPSSYEKAISLP